MQKLIILALSLGMVAAPGISAPSWVKGTATFERPPGTDKAILGSESIWHCENLTCRGRVPVHVKSAERYCRELARWGGPLVKFETGTTIFDAEALRRCNARK